jgi:hypothetical protein
MEGKKALKEGVELSSFTHSCGRAHCEQRLAFYGEPRFGTKASVTERKNETKQVAEHNNSDGQKSCRSECLFINSGYKSFEYLSKTFNRNLYVESANSLYCFECYFT